MDFLSTPSLPARHEARAERQVMVMFVPAESLRRVCVVPLELMAGVLLLVSLALRSRLNVSSSADTEQERPPGPRAIGQQTDMSGSAQSQQSSVDPPGIRDVSQRREHSSASSQESFLAESHAGDTAERNFSAVGGEDDPDSGIETALHDTVSEKNQSNEDGSDSRSGSGESNKEEEETSCEYGPFWPCTVHPPNQPQRFCDLTEEEQEEIMDADLKAYRKAWRPGDLKYIRWNPDPDVADEDQGQEAFHDENYEFFWWTPTPYRTTMEKHVFYPGNVTRYPVHGPVYCPACDRYVWEALPKRGECLDPVEQPVPATSVSRQGSYQEKPTQESPPGSQRDNVPAQYSCMSEVTETPFSLPAFLGVNSSTGSGSPWQVPLCSGQDGNLFHPEITAQEVVQCYAYQQAPGDCHEAPLHWTPDLAPSKRDFPLGHYYPGRPMCYIGPVADNGLMGRSADKAVQTRQGDFAGNPDSRHASGGQDSALTNECVLKEQEVSRDAAKLERLCIMASTLSSDGCEIVETDQESSPDVDCLERRLMEILERSDVECHIRIDDQTLDLRASQRASEDGLPCSSVEATHEQDIQRTQDRNSGAGITPGKVAATTEESKSTQGGKNRAGASKKRRNRKSRKLDQLKNDGLLDPRPGPSGRCGCGCEACVGCTGRSQPEAPYKVQPGGEAQHGQVHKAALYLSSNASDAKGIWPRDLNNSEAHHGRTRSEVESCQVSQSESVNKDESTHVTESNPSKAGDPFIDISFGDCEPIRIYKQTQRPPALPVRPFYEPLDRVMTPGMDVVLGDGCMARLIASGLDMDDFIITEGSGRRAKTMFLWPGPPTKPCVDLVGQKSHLTNFCVPTLPATIPETRFTGLDEQKCNPNGNEGTGESKQPPPNGSQMTEAEEHGKKTTQPSCAGHECDVKGNVENHSEVIAPSGNRGLSEQPGKVDLPSNITSSVDTTDVESVSPHSSEEGSKVQNKAKRRFRWTVNRIWKKKKEASTDPSSPFSTFESGSLSSDEGKQQKTRNFRVQDPFTPMNGHLTGVCKGAANQKVSSMATGQKSACANGNICVQHRDADLEHQSVEEQLHSKAVRMEKRRHAREVRRARRTVQHLRLVRRSYLRMAKAVRARKLAQQLGFGGSLLKNGIRRSRGIKKDCLETAAVAVEATADTNVHSFRQQLASVLGPAPQSPRPSRPDDAEGEPQAHCAEVAVNNRNIIDVYNAVTRIAESVSAREVEVELRPKDSPVPVPHKLDAAKTNRKRGAEVESEMAPQTLARAQCDNSQKRTLKDVPLSPHSKADGLWNGRRPDDPSWMRNLSAELATQESTEAIGDQVEETQQVGRVNPSSAISGSLSSHGVSDEVDLAGELEGSELGKLITLGAELEEPKPESSSVVMESHTSEATGNEHAVSEVCEESVTDGPGLLVGAEPRRRQCPPWDGRPLDALLWEPNWMQSPPLSPRTRLWTIFSKLSGGPNSSPQPWHAFPTELLPGAADIPSSDVEHPAEEYMFDSAHQSAPNITGGPGRAALVPSLRPEVLITSAHLQPEDNLLAHGDPARPWVRCHSRAEVKTLADVIASRYSRRGSSLNPVRPTFTHCPKPSFAT